MQGTEAASKKINVNNANLKDITGLPRIGKALAQRVIDSRPYSDIDDLKKVQGISEDMYKEIKLLITI